MVFKEVLTVIHCTHWTLAPPAPLPPSRPTPRSKRGTSLSLGHYSIMLGWVDGGKVQSGGESRAARAGFFCRRTAVAAVQTTIIVSLRISVLSVRLACPSVSCNQRQILCAAPTMAVAIHSPLPSSSSSRSRARIHMYLAPDTMDSEMAPLVDRPTETPPLDRKTEDDSGNGRRSERRGRRGSERAEERRGERARRQLCCRGHTLRLPEKAFLATSPLGALSTK